MKNAHRTHYLSVRLQSFLHKLTTSFRSELYTTVRQSGWKIHSSKVDTTQKHFKYGYIVNLIFLYKQIGDLLSIHSEAGLIFTIIDLIFTICHNFFSLPTSLSSTPQTRLPAVGQQFDKWQWIGTKQIFTHLGMVDSKPTNVQVVTKCLGLDAWHIPTFKSCSLTYIKQMFLKCL